MAILGSTSTIAVHRSEQAVSPFLRILTYAPRVDLDPDGPSVSIIIPARNEEKNLAWIARHMPANVYEIILVDGQSTDSTVATARSLWPDVHVVQQTRRGKGNALACGFHAATGDILVMIDADGSMDPGEIPYFVEALRNGACYAKGSRFATGGGSSDITALRAWGNRRLNGITALLHGTAYSDLCYGFNAFWRTLLPTLDLDPGTVGERSDARLWGDGFEVETLINIRVHAAGVKVAEVPSFESERLYGMSNLNTFRDGLRVLRTIALEKLVRWRHNQRLQRPGYSLALTDSLFADPASDHPSVPLTTNLDILTLSRCSTEQAGVDVHGPGGDQYGLLMHGHDSSAATPSPSRTGRLGESAMFRPPVCGERKATDGAPLPGQETDIMTVEFAEAEERLRELDQLSDLRGRTS